jgi:hypothetical protein
MPVKDLYDNKYTTYKIFRMRTCIFLIDKAYFMARPEAFAMQISMTRPTILWQGQNV